MPALPVSSVVSALIAAAVILQADEQPFHLEAVGAIGQWYQFAVPGITEGVGVGIVGNPLIGSALD